MNGHLNFCSTPPPVPAPLPQTPASDSFLPYSSSGSDVTGEKSTAENKVCVYICGACVCVCVCVCGACVMALMTRKASPIADA